jgi:hypothetical protein
MWKDNIKINRNIFGKDFQIFIKKSHVCETVHSSRQRIPQSGGQNAQGSVPYNGLEWGMAKSQDCSLWAGLYSPKNCHRNLDCSPRGSLRRHLRMYLSLKRTPLSLRYCDGCQKIKIFGNFSPLTIVGWKAWHYYHDRLCAHDLFV